jgi:hypothetical protein
VSLSFKYLFVQSIVNSYYSGYYIIKCFRSFVSAYLVLNYILKSLVELCYKGFLILVSPYRVLLKVGGITIYSTSLFKISKSSLCRVYSVNVSEHFVDFDLKYLKTAKQSISHVSLVS